MPATARPCQHAHYEGQDLEALADLPHYNRAILEAFAPYLAGRVLEVGAGTGNFSAYYADLVGELTLLEPAENLYPHLVERFSGQSHVRTCCALLEDFCAHRPWEKDFDAALMVNVLEHIPCDGFVVRRLTQLLRPGGALLIFVPALAWLYGTLDEMVHHCRRYSRPELRHTVEQAGLEVLHLRYFDLCGVVPWWVTGRVLKQRSFNARAARIYDRFVFPLAQCLERRLRLPLGKNLICVARRPLEDAMPMSVPFRKAA